VEEKDLQRILRRRPALSIFVRQQKDRIVGEWERAVRLSSAPGGLERPALRDQVSALLDQVAAMADALVAGDAATMPEGYLPDDGPGCLQDGLDLEEVILEIAALRDCVLRVWQEERRTEDELGELRLLDRALDRAVAVAVAQITRVRDRTLEALDRVALSGDSRELDELLGGLLEVILQMLPAVDTAAILLREGQRLRWRASAGLEASVSRQTVVAIGQGFAGGIARDGQPLMLRSAATDPRVDSEVLRRQGVRALFGIPLRRGEQVIGVAYMGSLGVHEFARPCRSLFTAMANRAATVIHLHMLREAAELRAAELEAVIEAIPDAVYISDAGGLQLINGAGLQLLGGERPERLRGDGRAILERLRPRDAATGRRIAHAELPCVRALRGERVLCELVVDDPVRGAALVSRVAAAPVITGGAISGAVAIAADITARKQEEQRQRLLVDAAAVLATSLDRDTILNGIIDLLVPGMADWCAIELVEDGQSVAAAVRPTSSAPDGAPAATAPAAGIARVLRTGCAERHGLLSPELLARLARDDRQLQGLRAIGAGSALIVPLVVRDRIGGALSVVAAGRRYAAADLELIEELARRAALALDNARLYEEAQRAARLREDLLAIVSHDLKNPLDAINMSAHLLSTALLPADESGRARRLVATIQRSASRMEYLIGDLLDMATVRAGRLALERRCEDAQALFEDALDLQEPLALEKGVRLYRQLRLQEVQLDCDRDRVMQVVANLVGNAVKFCRSEDSVTVSGELVDGMAQLIVRDCGPGVPEEERAHLFEPYWSAQRHARRGTGLGLYIARGIVEAHGGRIWVESEVGVGSSFCFTLPARRA
jgi:signal transduction histidine kinase/PAS domain-containing protein